jgi:ketosteroid isomerase-like protein
MVAPPPRWILKTYAVKSVKFRPNSACRAGLPLQDWEGLTMFVITVFAFVFASISAPAGQAPADAPTQVREAERAFAKTMADRDHAAFASFLAEDAIFLGPNNVLRGRKAIVDGWKRYYEGAQAPFAWAPERVEVIDSGSLAISTGPVTDPSGKRIGTFTTTWRREPNGQWRVVLDSGCPPCPCK